MCLYIPYDFQNKQRLLPNQMDWLVFEMERVYFCEVETGILNTVEPRLSEIRLTENRVNRNAFFCTRGDCEEFGFVVADCFTFC